jgi:hypothetical protein
MKKLSIALAVVFAGSALFIMGQQAEQIKKKAKDLKKNVESGQTNSAGKTNAPPKAR